MNKIKNIVNSFLNEQVSCLNLISKDEEIIKIINKLIRTRDQGNKIFTFGNGGSSSTASHFVSDLLKTAIIKGKKRFKAISLVDNIPVLLAWSNDMSFENIFVEQLKNYISKNDVIVCFSGSGNSQNIVKALQYAKRNGVFCIGITGKSGGKMKRFCDICFRIPSNDMLTIESQHLILCHCIISAIRSTGNPVFKYE